MLGFAYAGQSFLDAHTYSTLSTFADQQEVLSLLSLTYVGKALDPWPCQQNIFTWCFICSLYIHLGISPLPKWWNDGKPACLSKKLSMCRVWSFLFWQYLHSGHLTIKSKGLSLNVEPEERLNLLLKASDF